MSRYCWHAEPRPLHMVLGLTRMRRAELPGCRGSDASSRTSPDFHSCPIQVCQLCSALRLAPQRRTILLQPCCMLSKVANHTTSTSPSPMPPCAGHNCPTEASMSKIIWQKIQANPDLSNFCIPWYCQTAQGSELSMIPTCGRGRKTASSQPLPRLQHHDRFPARQSQLRSQIATYDPTS